MTSGNSAISSSAARSDVLCSGSDGVYDVSFFAASIRHTIGRSRDVFGQLSGPSLAAFADEWMSMDDEDRQAFLLEHHEFAHHALMFSTPAGVLNWRMNQVISRDVQWVLLKCGDFGVTFPEGATPRELVATKVWQAAVKRRNDVPRGVKHQLLLTIQGLEDVLLLRSILFGPGAAARHAELTFRDLRRLLNRTFTYLEMRCDATLRKDWRTRLPPDTKVFPPGRDFNLVDIAEVHAIAMELFVLRSIGDLEGLRARAARAARGPYGSAFQIAVEATKNVNELGLSPHQMQLLALISFASGLDVAPKGSGPIYIEDALPWWRFARGAGAVTMEIYSEALANCLALATQPLVGAGSRWLQLANVGWYSLRNPSLETIGAVTQTVAALGLDRQIHAVHRGARLNWRYLATQLEASLGKRVDVHFERLSGEAWRGEIQSAVLLVEYKDGLHFDYADYQILYPEGSPYRSTVKDLDSYGSPSVQLMGQILNGALPRIMYAAYTGCAVPSLEVLKPKLSSYFESESTAASMVDLIRLLLERGAAVADGHLTLVPESVRLERYI